MKWAVKNIASIILATMVLLMAIFLFTMLKKKEAPSPSMQAVSKAYQAAIDAKDETIAVYREQNTTLEASIQEHQRVDSLLLVKLVNNQPKYLTNDKKIKDAVAAVYDLDREQLRREYANY